MYKIDAAMRILHDPMRRFYIKLSRKKMYDPVEFLLSDAIGKWNDGEALDEYSQFFVAYIRIVEGRAIAVSRGKMSTIRQHNTVCSNALRGALRGVAGPGT